MHCLKFGAFRYIHVTKGFVGKIHGGANSS